MPNFFEKVSEEKIRAAAAEIREQRNETCVLDAALRAWPMLLERELASMSGEPAESDVRLAAAAAMDLAFAAGEEAVAVYRRRQSLRAAETGGEQ